MEKEEDLKLPQDKFFNLACDIFPGHLTTVSICRASSIYDGFAKDRPDIPLDLTWLMPDGYDQRVLRLDTQRVWLKDYTGFNDKTRRFPSSQEPGAHFLVGILPENRWPSTGPDWDEFVGKLGRCTGQYIQWCTTLSGTESDIRLGKVLVSVLAQPPGSPTLATQRTFSIQREDVPAPSPLTIVSM